MTPTKPSRTEALCTLAVTIHRDPAADARTLAQELAEGRPRFGQYVDTLTALGFRRFITEATKLAKELYGEAK